MLKPSLQLKLGQQLTMTPQLQQAIRLLQLPAIELQAHISELLESNVMLEPTDDEAAPEFEPLPTDAIAQGGPAEDSSTDRDESTPEVEILDEGWDDRSTGSGESSRGDDDDRERDIADPESTTLRDHLLGQLELASLSPTDLAIASAIVDAISDEGYLVEPLAEIAATLR